MIVKPPSGMITVSFLGALSSLRVILPERNQDDLGHFWKLRFGNEELRLSSKFTLVSF